MLRRGSLVLLVLVLSSLRLSAQVDTSLCSRNSHDWSIGRVSPPVGWWEQADAWFELLRQAFRQGGTVSPEDYRTSVSLPPDLAAAWVRDSATTEYALASMITDEDRVTAGDAVAASVYYYALSGRALPILGALSDMADPWRRVIALESVRGLDTPSASRAVVQDICAASHILVSSHDGSGSTATYSRMLQGMAQSLLAAYKLMDPGEQRAIRPTVLAAVPGFAGRLTERDQ